MSRDLVSLSWSMTRVLRSEIRDARSSSMISATVVAVER